MGAHLTRTRPLDLVAGGGSVVAGRRRCPGNTCRAAGLRRGNPRPRCRRERTMVNKVVLIGQSRARFRTLPDAGGRSCQDGRQLKTSLADGRSTGRHERASIVRELCGNAFQKTPVTTERRARGCASFWGFYRQESVAVGASRGLITQRSLVQIQPLQPRRDKGFAVAAANPFVVSAPILHPLHRVSGHASCADGATWTLASAKPGLRASRHLLTPGA